MSEPENFLTRWVRRKHDATQANAEPQTVGPNNTADSKVSAATSSIAGPPDKPVSEIFDLKTLPPIDSITGASDIRAFLAPGVPPELTRAALRRVWAADPQIRDFVGLAEYAWDYHASGAMAGFGPLQMTDELSRIVSRILDGSAGEKGSLPWSQVSATRENTKNFNPEETPTPGGSSNSKRVTQVANVNKISLPCTPDLGAQRMGQDTAVQKKDKESQTLPSIERRRHGGALPE